MSREKRIGVALDFSKGSKKALTWAIDNLAREGDHLILITIHPECYYEYGEMQLWETTGSPFLPFIDFSDPHNMKKYEVHLDADTLYILNAAATEKQISVLMKIFWGDAREKICEAIDQIPLSCLVMGNKGLGTLKRFLESLLAPDVSYTVAVTAFWAIEAVYYDSYAHCLDDDCRTPEELRETCKRWGNDDFGQYCESLKSIANRRLAKGSKDVISKAETVFLRVLELEIDFWSMSNGET